MIHAKHFPLSKTDIILTLLFIYLAMWISATNSYKSQIEPNAIRQKNMLKL